LQFDHDDLELAAGFAAVRQYDPDTYARMRAARWHVSVNPFDLALDFGLSLMSEPHSMMAEGVTLPGPAASGGVALTWINIELMRAMIQGEKIGAAVFMAEVLVHEFAHIHTEGHNEQEAFTAGSAFAVKIPGRDGNVLLRASEDAAAFERANPVAYNPGAYGLAG